MRHGVAATRGREEDRGFAGGSRGGSRGEGRAAHEDVYESRNEGTDKNSDEDRADETALAQKTPGELLEPVVAAGLGVLQDLPDVLRELRLAPAVSGRVLGAVGLADPRGFQENA